MPHVPTSSLMLEESSAYSRLLSTLLSRLSDATVIGDHQTADISAEDELRIRDIPEGHNDWHCLENKQVVLPDGSMLMRLHYNWNRYEGRYSGVCECQNLGTLHQQQRNTFIPWWLPHTGLFSSTQFY